jgi:hypothetical protein
VFCYALFNLLFWHSNNNKRWQEEALIIISLILAINRRKIRMGLVDNKVSFYALFWFPTYVF